jgi:hypothetical protein
MYSPDAQENHPTMSHMVRGKFPSVGIEDGGAT